MSPPTAGFADPERTHRRRCVLDASVLYQELIRNLLLWIAAEGGLDPFWTERILDETRRNLIEDGVLGPEQWERLRAAMLAAFRLRGDQLNQYEQGVQRNHCRAASSAHSIWDPQERDGRGCDCRQQRQVKPVGRGVGGQRHKE